jgi:riboflavin synthase alpha subunit
MSYVQATTKSIPLKHINLDSVKIPDNRLCCDSTVCNCVCETVRSVENDMLLSNVTDDSLFYTKDQATNETQKYLLVDTVKLTNKVA